LIPLEIQRSGGLLPAGYPAILVPPIFCRKFTFMVGKFEFPRTVLSGAFFPGARFQFKSIH